MALTKELTNNKGITTNYHRVSHVSLNNNTLHCSVESYVAPEYRAMEQYADTLHFSFHITIEEEESMGIRALCYTKIKELTDWANAIDC